MSNNSQLSSRSNGALSPEKTLNFKVWVRCATFNHASYITATMDGFCLQQTNFPYVCIIIDDASTDGNQAVIEQYLHDYFDTEWLKETDDYHLTLARHKENKNCYFAAYLLKYNHYSIKKSKDVYYQDLIAGTAYIALCEGDDYWTDEYKLQKQADALDANPQAVMVYTGFRNIDAEDKPISRPRLEGFSRISHSGDNLPTLLRNGNYVMTLTTMYRCEILQAESFKYCPNKLDFALTLSASLIGDFIWMPEQTANYRSLQSGMVMSNHPKVKQMTKDIYRYYAGLLMSGMCKSLSFLQRIHITTLILLWVLKSKDQQFRKDTLKISLLARLLLPVAYVRLKCERLRDRIQK